jgi:hypothetical protein
MPRVVPLVVGLVVLGAFSWLGSACAPGGSQGSSEGTENNTDPVVNCSGLYGTTPSPDGTYYITAFGCYSDSQGAHGDPGDNCIPACLSQAQQSVCAGMSGPACEESVNWYTADSGRYGCMTRLRVTNPANGKSLVVLVLDAGPACFVEQNVNHAVLDMSPPSNIYLFGSEQGQADKALVDVVVVDPSTPLGPTTASSSSSSSSSGSAPACSVGGVAGTCIATSACAAKSGYVSTAGYCPGGATEECCTPKAGSGSSSSSSSTSSTTSSSSSSSSTSSSGAVPPSCDVDGTAGTCIDTSVCATKTGYTSTPGYCPGSASEECCTPPPSCTVNGVSGICIDTSLCATLPGGTSTPGYCPGSASEECCTQ